MNVPLWGAASATLANSAAKVMEIKDFMFAWSLG
jgi:hypothetical protein